MKRKEILVSALALTVAAGLIGCGGPAAPEPTKADFKKTGPPPGWKGPGQPGGPGGPPPGPPPGVTGGK